MSLLPDSLKRCVRIAMENESLTSEETVSEAFRLHYELTGGPIDVEDDEEGMNLVREAFAFVADEVLHGLVLKGVMEFAGVDENGELTVRLAVIEGMD